MLRIMPRIIPRITKPDHDTPEHAPGPGLPASGSRGRHAMEPPDMPLATGRWPLVLMLALNGCAMPDASRSSHAMPDHAGPANARLAVLEQDVELQPIGRIKHPPIDETSGLVKSRRFDNVWWVHNDSGDQARLFAIDDTGSAIMPHWRSGRYYVDQPSPDPVERDDDAPDQPWPGYAIAMAANYDWEDIALDGDLLYIGDIGNNGNARQDLGIYVLHEPNPRAIEGTRALKHLPVRYPDQTQFPAAVFQFDAESLFVSQGRLYILTKHRVGQSFSSITDGTRLYRLDTNHTDRVNVLTLVDRLDKPLADGLSPTAADLSPDGRTLAVLSEQSVWLFHRPRRGDRWLTDSPRVRRLNLTGSRPRQAEAITWDDANTLRIANEQRDLFRVTLPPPPTPAPAVEAPAVAAETDAGAPIHN